MGVTNIRSGQALLERAGSNHDQPALIPESANRRIYLEPRSISNEELEIYIDLLSMPRSEQDRWVDVKTQSLQSPAEKSVLPQAIIAPKVVLSPGLSTYWRKKGRKTEEQLLQEPDDLAFIAIVQGLAGAGASKVVMRYSAGAIANAMFHELMNGYSIVFSGVLLKSEERKKSGLNVLWQKAETYDQLMRIQKSNEGLLSPSSHDSATRMHKVGIVC